MKISVIIPVYNVERYVRQALDSILDQCYGDVELICVDDGFQDSSGAILDEVSTQDERVKVFHQQNSGVGEARNRAIKESVGDWLIFLDADDVANEHLCQDVVDAVNRHPDADLVAFRRVEFNEVDEPKWMNLSASREIVLPIENEVPTCLAGVLFAQFAFKRSIVSTFPRYSQGEDIVFMIKCFERATKCVYLNRFLYGYRVRSGSAMHSSFSMTKLRDSIDYTSEMFRLIELSTKHYGVGFIRPRANLWVEDLPDYIFKFKSGEEKGLLWNEWMNSMEHARKISLFSAWQHLVVVVISLTRCKLLVLLLCVAPRRLKLMGFHR